MSDDFVVNFNYEENVEKELKAPEEDSGNRAAFIKIVNGENKIRFLPPTTKCPVLMQKVDLHWLFVNGKPTPVRCIADVHGKCPICEDAQAHYKIGDKDGASKKRAKTQYLYNVMDKDGKIGILGADKNLASEIDKKHKAIQQEAEKPFNFFGAADGVWMIITKTQEKVPGKSPPFDKKNKFELIATQRNKCPITAEMKEAVLEGVKDLSKIYPAYTYEELSKKYYGTPEETKTVAATDAPAAGDTVVVEEPPLVDDADVEKFINDLSI